VKTLGLIGGISYHSTAVYYNMINHRINEKSGGNNAAKMLLYSVNYNDFTQLQNKNDWNGIEMMLSEIAVKLEKAGADCILISCNTAHLIADALMKKINVPFIHIADATAKELFNHGLTKVALIGTKSVMENSFFIDRLTGAGIETIIPHPFERALIQSAILDELSHGRISTESKAMFQMVIQDLKMQGAEAVVLGCTEIGLFIAQSDSELKIFDTTIIHSNAAVEFAIS
jgi:aspartate racemase